MTTTKANAITHPKRGPSVGPELQPMDPGSLAGESLAARAGLVTLGSRVPLRTYMADIWNHREFATTVSVGQLRAKNEDTMLGRAWNLLNPLLLIAIYYLIFQVILGVENRRGVDNYLPFLTVGVLTYNFSRSTAQGGALAIIKNRGLMQTLYFPRALLPISSTIGLGISQLYAVGAMLILLPLMGVRPTRMLLLFPVVFLIHAMLNVGVAFVVARITFHFRDFENLLSYILRLGMYVSGVLIPINAELISNDVVLWTLRLTPFFSIIEMTRQTLLGTPFDPVIWGVGILWAVALMAGGMLYFRQAENEYASA